MKHFAKRFAKYVHSRNRLGCLIHEVKAVELRWTNWRGERLDCPQAIITTKCGVMRYSRYSFLRHTIEAGMIECRACKGLGATVSSKRDQVGPSGLTWHEATDRLARLTSSKQVIQ